MFQEVLDPFGSKSLTLDKGPTLPESIVRQVGLNPQLPPPPVKASAISFYSKCHYHHHPLIPRAPAPSNALSL